MATSTLPIPADFTVSYNGFVFDPASTVTTALRVRPVEDATKRTVAYNEIYLRLKTEVSGGGPTDAVVLAARQKLTKFGGVLVYSGRGFGPLSINTGRVKDVLFGPKPKELSFRPLGYKYACELEWEVTVHIPECADARYALGFLELSYRVEFHIRKDGKTDRVVSGTVRIPNNRTAPGSTEVLDSPDRYREMIAPPVPYWFRREWQPWKVDEGRTTLGFGWKDSEFGRNCFPPGIVAGDVSHDVKQENKGVAVAALGCTLHGWFEVADGFDSTAAENAFWQVVRQRVFDRKGRYPIRAMPGQKVAFIPMSFDAREPSLLGDVLRCEFTFSYRIVGTNLREAVLHSGLWEQLGNDWRAWQASVQASALHPRGSTKITFLPVDDQIVDLCGGTPGGLKPIGGTRRPYFQDVAGLPFPPLDEGLSWLVYRNFVQFEIDSGVVRTRSLAQSDGAKPAAPETSRLQPWAYTPGQPGNLSRSVEAFLKPTSVQWAELLQQKPSAGKGSGGTGGGAGVGKGNPPPGGGAEGKTAPGPGESPIQRRAEGTAAVVLVGEALRVGWPISPPIIRDVGGVEAVLDNRPEMGEGFVTGIVGTTMTGAPIFAARWRMRFIFPRVPPGDLPIPVEGAPMGGR